MPPAIPDRIPCESVHQLEQELATLRETLSLEETEETWDRIARALARFSAIVKGGGYKFEKELVNGVRASARPIISAMNSERTRLSAAALECITIIAPRIGLTFEALVPLFVPHILRLSTRSNKVYVTRSQATLGLILGYCHISSIIPYLLIACKESKIATGRAVAVEGVLRSLNKWDWAQRDIKNKVGDVEEVIKITGRDKDPGIRQTSRKVFEAYKILFPERVDEFTGPLTPVMRKYLDIKPQSHAQNPVERALPPRPLDKPRRPQLDLAASTSAVPTTSAETRAALGAHARSASSNAVVGGSSASTGSSHSHPPDAATIARSMPPPAIIPSQTRNASRSQSQSRVDHPQSQYNHCERQRVLSAASTYSTKSAPSTSHPEYERQPPARLHSRSARVNPVVTGSSGQARRVPKAVAVEPHPANRPDPSAMAHKAPVRPTPLQGGNAPRVFRPKKGAGREPLDPAQSALTSATGIAFPTSEPSSAPVERKGAQRVPKPALPPSAAPPKVEQPATMTIAPKREIKPSLFRRGATGLGDKESEKKKEAFAPRRGGGVTQPTLSQLSKQKPPAGASGPAVPPGKKAAGAPTAPAGSNRPVWGASAKAVHIRGVPASRGRGRGGIARVPTTRQADTTKVKPAMVPLPASPGRERDIVPQLVPLPESPKPIRTDVEQRDERLHLGEEAAGEVPEVAEGPASLEQDPIENHTEEVPAVAENPIDDAPVQSTQVVFAAQAAFAPHTPPFPSAQSDSDEDELEAIEFTTRDAYDPAGVPVKTPRKVANVMADWVHPERNPLGEVVLNG